mmetsp:Transcript_22810/g.51440  ORF Transcript_22810/g.51440 Transcript_22810/m.51440 type:complete len:83 (+) Transcript_22810:494-742(+)
MNKYDRFCKIFPRQLLDIPSACKFNDMNSRTSYQNISIKLYLTVIVNPAKIKESDSRLFSLIYTFIESRKEVPNTLPMKETG